MAKNYWDVPPTEEQKEQLEPELFAELNQLPEEEDELEEVGAGGSRSSFLRIAGLITALAFITIFLGNSLQAFTWPSMDFIQESQELSQDPEVQELKQSVGLINIANRRGTGFYLEPHGLFVTNEHVVRGASKVTASFVDGSLYSGEKVASFPDVDLAFVKLNERGGKPAHVELEASGGEGTIPGQEVTIIGNPMGFPQIVKRGTVLGEYSLNNREEPVMAIEAPIHQGSSGSPVFNEQGKVVGVIFATLRNPDDSQEQIIGLAIPLDQLRERLDKYKNSLPDR